MAQQPLKGHWHWVNVPTPNLLSPPCNHEFAKDGRRQVRMAEDIDFKYPVKLACAAEIAKFCTGIEHGQANIVRCLQDFTEDPDMSSECRDEVIGDQNRAAQDYR